MSKLCPKCLGNKIPGVFRQDDCTCPTVKQVNWSHVRALREEAACAGDSEQVAVCDRALDGDEGAYLACVEVIRYAAMRAKEDT